jgi:hypothetical protein
MARTLHIYMKIEVFSSSSMEHRTVRSACFYVFPDLPLSIITSSYSLQTQWAVHLVPGVIKLSGVVVGGVMSSNFPYSSSMFPRACRNMVQSISQPRLSPSLTIHDDISVSKMLHKLRNYNMLKLHTNNKRSCTDIISSQTSLHKER